MSGRGVHFYGEGKAVSKLSSRHEYVMINRFAQVSQKDIAESMGVSTGTIQHLEREAWQILKDAHQTIEHWEIIYQSGKSMKKIAEMPASEKHSLADVMV